MNKIEFKKISLNLLILILIFFIDRLTKIYILNLAEIENSVDIYITPYLKFIFSLE